VKICLSLKHDYHDAHVDALYLLCIAFCCCTQSVQLLSTCVQAQPCLQSNSSSLACRALGVFAWIFCYCASLVLHECCCNFTWLCWSHLNCQFCALQQLQCRDTLVRVFNRIA
jgi:hypothetical protein